MATFLFVPGAWHGGWSFDPLASELVARRHQVIAIDLPLGPELPTLSSWARLVANAARAYGEKVILAGHSRGGLVVSAAAELDPDAFESLVYIAAFLVPDGRSAAEFLSTTPRLDAFERGLSVSADGMFLLLDKEAAIASMAQLCEAKYRREFSARLQPDPIEPLTAAMTLTKERFASLPRAYVECAQDLALQHSVQRAMQQAQPCERVYSLDCDHTPMLSATIPLAEALDSWASRQKTDDSDIIR